jgi:ribosomal-protein-alanine N-acetyltransferase
VSGSVSGSATGAEPGSESAAATGGWTMRAMTAADIPAVHALEVRLFPSDAWPERMFREELAQARTRAYWVVEDDGGIVAYCGLMCVLPLADVQTIAVVPEREGRGIGTALLNRLVAEAGARGAEDVLLEVRADNPRAQALYVRFGFEQIHVRRGYYPGGVDALIMRKTLPGASDEDSGGGHVSA